MKKHSTFLLSLIFLMMVPGISFGAVRNVIFDRDNLKIHCQLGKSTEIVFPDKVARIIKKGFLPSLAIEAIGNSLHVMPRQSPVASVTVLTVKGKSVTLDFIPGNMPDEKVFVSYREDHDTAKSRNGVIAIMRSLFLGRPIAGATVMEGLNQEILNNGSVKINVLTKYELPNVTAMVLTVQNLLDRSIVVPVQQISLPKLIAIASEEDVLRANGREGDQTLLFMIVRN